MEIYNKLNTDLKNRIDLLVKKAYFKNHVAPQIENKYKKKIKNKMFSLYYRIFGDSNYLYNLAIFETDILYYLNDFKCFRSSMSMNNHTQDFLSKCFKKTIINYKQYTDTIAILSKNDLILKLINSFTINQIDDFYNKSFIKNSVSF
tara:strand:- start:508 stop:948 length:441 start_codon:yes stop_codon:yes gene_type:complete